MASSALLETQDLGAQGSLSDSWGKWCFSSSGEWGGSAVPTGLRHGCGSYLQAGSLGNFLFSQGPSHRHWPSTPYPGALRLCLLNLKSDRKYAGVDAGET